MSADRLEDILDLLAWILGGLLFGLLVLGTYNGYREYQRPSTPSVALEPLDESDVEPVSNEPSFQSPEKFYLVRTLAPEEDEEEESPTEPSSQANKEPEQRPEELPTSDLPYELLGTTTGAPEYTSAVIRHKSRRETRTLGENQEWEDLRVLSIEDDFVLIRNLTRNRRERIPLNDRAASTP